MVEVYKTNVENSDNTAGLFSALQMLDEHYQINFDLEDCDRILRIKNPVGEVESEPVIETLKRFGFCAEILGD